jgi:hypothetical protein
MQSSNHDFLCWCYVLRWIWCLWCYSECISTPGKLEKCYMDIQCGVDFHSE